MGCTASKDGKEVSGKLKGKPLVTITGVAGYIGSQICLDFLKSGEFRVRGTVRDHKN